MIGGELALLENVHPCRSSHWRLTTEDAYRVRREAEAVFHSHPLPFCWPSRHDIAQAMHFPRAHAIVPVLPGPGRGTFHAEHFGAFWYGDGVGVRPLLGRPFRFGVTDCLSLVRDAAAQHGIMLREHPRDWWELVGGAPLYDDGFADEGFRELPRGTALEPGDVFLWRIRSKVSNHASIYMGLDDMYHHPCADKPYDPSALSRADSMARYLGTEIPRRHLRHRSRD